MWQQPAPGEPAGLKWAVTHCGVKLGDWLVQESPHMQAQGSEFRSPAPMRKRPVAGVREYMISVPRSQRQEDLVSKLR